MKTYRFRALVGVLFLVGIFAFGMIGIGDRLKPAEAAVESSAEGYTYVVTTEEDLPDILLGDGICSTQQDECSLRAAIQQANYEPGHDTIQLPVGTFNLTIPGTGEDLSATGDLDILDSLTIEGAGKSISRVNANDIDRVFHINGATVGGVTVTLRMMTIENGNLPENPTSYQARNGGGIWFSNFSGGWLPGSLTLDNVNLRSNQASDGDPGSSSNNSGGHGGGIYSMGNLILNHSEVEYNRAGNGDGGSSNGSGGNGGGIHAQGSLTISYSTVEHNDSGMGWPLVAATAAGGSGGEGAGIYFEDRDGDIYVEGSLIRYNQGGSGGSSTASNGGSGGDGAGIWGLFKSLTMVSSQINYNFAGNSGSGLNESTTGWPKGGRGGGMWVQNSFLASGSGVVNLTNTYLIGNQAGDGLANGAWGGGGGGIYYYYDGDNLGSLTLTDCLLINNIAGNGANGDERGGYGGEGGAIYLDKVPVTITNSRFSGNRAGDGGDGNSYGGYGGGGGAIKANNHSSFLGSTVTLTNSTFNNNTAGDGGNGNPSPGIGGHGGGIHLENQWSATINRSTINGNSAGAGGTGGTRVFAGDGGGVHASLTMNSSTVSGNMTHDGSDTASGLGGAVFGAGVIRNSTITNNTTSIHTQTAVVGFSISGSIIAGNLPLDCTWITSTGYNLLGIGCSGVDPTDMINVDPKLGALQDNGGPTKSHALQPGSPAIETGDPASCPTADQRGYTRPVDNDGDLTPRCDIGSFEAQFLEATTVYSYTESSTVSFGATGVTITRTLGTTDPMTTTVTLNSEPPGGGSPDPGEMALWWNIDAYVDTGLGLDLLFCYTDDQLGGLDETSLQVYSNDGGGWTNQGGTVDLAGNCVSVTGISDLSEWTLATAMPASDARLYLPLIIK